MMPKGVSSSSHVVHVMPPAQQMLGCSKTADQASKVLESAIPPRHNLPPWPARHPDFESFADLDTPKIAKEEIDNLLVELEKFQDILRCPPEVMDRIAGQAAEELTENILAEQRNRTEEGTVAFIQELQDSPVPDFDLLDPMLFEEAFFREAAVAEVGIVATNILSRGGMAVATGIVLNKVEDIIKAKRELLDQMARQGAIEEFDALAEDIKVLTAWLKVHSQAFKEQLKTHVVFSLLSAPKAGVAIARVVEKASLAGNVLGWIFVGTTLINQALKYREAQRNVRMHDDWARVIEPKKEDVAKIVAQYKADFEARLKDNRESLDELLEFVKKELSGLDDNHAPGGALNRLKEAGIEVPIKTPTAGELQAWLMKLETPHQCNVQMVKKNLERSETISATLRNGLQASIQKKERIDRGFLKVARSKAKATFAAASVVTALMITFKVLSVVGVAVLGAAVVATGYGIVAVIVGGLIMGAVYLRMKKPNLFKTYIEGVQAKLFFRNIPLGIQKYRRHYASLQAKKVSQEVAILGFKIGSASESEKGALQRSQGQKQEKLDKLNRKKEKLKNSIDGMEKKVKVLQERIITAGFADFDRLFSNKKIDSADSAVEIVSHLTQDETLMQNDRMKELFSHMGIEPPSFERLKDKKVQEELIWGIRGFFAMEEGETLKLIKQHRLAKLQAADQSAG